MNGVFFNERLIPYFFLLSMMNLSEYFFLERVLYPLAGIPLRERGRPPAFLPSPPPIGRSTGFITTPRTRGRRPNQRERPAFPETTSECSPLETAPIVAIQVTRIIRVSPEGILMIA